MNALVEEQIQTKSWHGNGLQYYQRFERMAYRSGLLPAALEDIDLVQRMPSCCCNHYQLHGPFCAFLA